MSINFNEDRWAQTIENYEAWWQGTLGRPLIFLYLNNGEPTSLKPSVPLLLQENAHRFDYSEREVVEAIDYEMSKYDFLADSYPIYPLDAFGPGVVAAFCGAVLDNSSGNVWFHPEKELPLSEIHVAFDKNNKWVKRIQNIIEAGIEKWHGNVVLSMPDLGGVFDIMATFRGSQDLLMDLYDEPEEVLRLRDEVITAWFDSFHAFEPLLMQQNGCYCDWTRMLSKQPYHILQSDFSFMVGPEHFDELIKDDLIALSKGLVRSAYHCDGEGELNKLDSILTIDSIEVFQWVPGDGAKNELYWGDVYRKANAAGKKFMVHQNEFETIDFLVNEIQVDPGKIFKMHTAADVSRKQELLEKLKQYGF